MRRAKQHREKLENSCFGRPVLSPSTGASENLAPHEHVTDAFVVEGTGAWVRTTSPSSSPPSASAFALSATPFSAGSHVKAGSAT